MEDDETEPDTEMATNSSAPTPTPMPEPDTSKEDAADGPKRTKTLKRVKHRGFDVMVYWFDKGQQGFVDGRSLHFERKHVESVYTFRDALQQMLNIRRCMIKTVITKTGKENSVHRIANAAMFVQHFRALEKDQGVAETKKIVGVIHSAGESAALINVVKEQGFRIY